MNVREALEKILHDTRNDLYVPPEALFAPIIERAARTAYRQGAWDHMESVPVEDMNSDSGVTAFVAAMVKES